MGKRFAISSGKLQFGNQVDHETRTPVTAHETCILSTGNSKPADQELGM